MADDLEELALLSLIILCDEEDQQLSFKKSLSLYGKRMRSATIRRTSLQPVADSAFCRLFASRQDDALVTLCGFDHASFRCLLALFEPPFNHYTPYYGDGTGKFLIKRSQSRGRPRQVTSTVALGLVLAWTRTRGSSMVLQLIFGLTASVLSLWLRFGRRILVRILRNHPKARVEMPNGIEIASFKAAINVKYPSLTNVWGSMDGLKLFLQQAGRKDGKGDVQNYFYNGWTHDHYVSNLFLFSPDGKIRKYFLNAPGCWHDSTLANSSGMYDDLDRIFEAHDEAQVVVDSAFSKDNRPSLVKSHQNIMDRLGNIREHGDRFRDATSVRQMAEWGMRGLQGSFPRLKDRLLYEERGERKIILHLIVLLYNFRASTVGINQIQSSFMPNLLRSANRFAR
jgi:DDE superfamily endonuclease